MIMMNTGTPESLTLPSHQDENLSLFQRYLSTLHVDDLSASLLRYHQLPPIHKSHIIETLCHLMRTELENAFYHQGGLYENVVTYATILFAIEPHNLEPLKSRTHARYMLAKQAQHPEHAEQYYLLAITDLDTLLAADSENLWVQEHLSNCLLGYSQFHSPDKVIRCYQRIIKLWNQLDKRRQQRHFSHAGQWWELVEQLRESSQNDFREIWPIFREHFEQVRDQVKGSMLIAWLEQLSHLYSHKTNYRHNPILEQDILCLMIHLNVQLKDKQFKINSQELRHLSQALVNLSYTDFPQPHQQPLKLAIKVLKKTCQHTPHDAHCWYDLSKAQEQLSNKIHDQQTMIDALHTCIEGAYFGSCSPELSLQSMSIARRVLSPQAADDLSLTLLHAASINVLGYRNDIYIEMFEIYARRGESERANAALETARDLGLINDYAQVILNSESKRRHLQHDLITLLQQDLKDSESFRHPIPGNHCHHRITQALQSSIPKTKDEFDPSTFWQAVKKLQAHITPVTSSFHYWLRLKQARLLMKAFHFLNDEADKVLCLKLIYEWHHDAEEMRPGFHAAPLAGCLRAMQLAQEEHISMNFMDKAEAHWHTLRENFGRVMNEKVIKITILQGHSCQH